MLDAGYMMTEAGCEQTHEWSGAMSGSYRDLEVYQLAHSLGVMLHRFSLRLPKYELHETGSQWRRASKSISAVERGHRTGK
jgi:hypothetical protein